MAFQLTFSWKVKNIDRVRILLITCIPLASPGGSTARWFECPQFTELFLTRSTPKQLSLVLSKDYGRLFLPAVSPSSEGESLAEVSAVGVQCRCARPTRLVELYFPGPGTLAMCSQLKALGFGWNCINSDSFCIWGPMKHFPLKFQPDHIWLTVHRLTTCTMATEAGKPSPTSPTTLEPYLL